jgi:CIC family chloride channel protein
MRLSARLRFLVRDAAQQQMLLAGVAGLLGAFSSLAFRAAISLLVAALKRLEAPLAGLPWLAQLLLPCAGGLVAGTILVVGARIRDRSTTDYMEATVIGDGRMGFRRTIAKCLSSLSSIVSGGSIGREGSMVQLGALMASLLGRLVPLPVSSRSLLIGCGAAAGLASVYNAPLASTVFIAEIVMGSLAFEVLGPLLVAAVVSGAVTRVIFGVPPLYLMHSPPLESWWQLVIFALIGPICALLAPPYLGALAGTSRLFALVPGTIWKLGLGGLLAGAVAIWDPRVAGNGETVIQQLMHPDTVPLVGMLALLFLAKLVATAVTTGSGAVGGVLTPTLCLGAVIGALYARLCHLALPGLAPATESCVVIGMGAFFASCAQAPVTAMLLVFEMTLDDTMTLPLALACLASFYLARRLGVTGIYALGGRQREREAALPSWSRLRIRDLLKPTGPVVHHDDGFPEIAQSFHRHQFNFIFVTDRQGVYRGAIALQDIKDHLSDQQLGSLAIAQDLLIDLPALQAADSLAKALEAFARHPGNRVPVVDERGQLLGCVHKYDVMLAFAHGTIAPAAVAKAAEVMS